MKIKQEEPASFCSMLAFDCKHVHMYCLTNKLTGDSHLPEVNYFCSHFIGKLTFKRTRPVKAMFNTAI